jgi:nucleoid-associated protein YgaU
MNAVSVQQSGESSWAIAQRFYGDGKHEVRLFEAKGVRAHPDARGLTHPGVNYPGWVLRLPEPARDEERSEEE